MDDDHAAAYLAGAGYLTGYLALTELAKFKPGQTVLAPAIGSAVGMETLQIARRLGASLAISTGSTTEKAERAREDGYGCSPTAAVHSATDSGCIRRNLHPVGFRPGTRTIKGVTVADVFLSAGVRTPFVKASGVSIGVITLLSGSCRTDHEGRLTVCGPVCRWALFV